MRVTPAAIVDFKACRVIVEPLRILTVFRDDGSVSVMDIPSLMGKEDHLDATRHCGYGEDQRRMAVEHELAHAYVAEKLGWPHSVSVWGDAHGKRPGTPWSPKVTTEECAVVALQRYVQTGELDRDGYLAGTWGEGVGHVAGMFQDLVREVERALPVR